MFVLLVGVWGAGCLKALGLCEFSDKVHDEGQEREGKRKQGVGVKELDHKVNPGIFPLSIEVSQDFVVRDSEHDDEDPEEDHADQKLVHHPHWHHCSLQKF